MEPIVVGIIALVVGAVAGVIFGRWQLTNQQRTTGQSLLTQAEATSKTILESAGKEANQLVEDANQRAQNKLDEADTHISRRRKELEQEDDALSRRRVQLDKRMDDIERRSERMEQREQQLSKRQSALDRKANELKTQQEEQMEEMQRIAQMTMEEARSSVLETAEKEARNDMARIIRQVEAEAREEADRRAREIISMVVQRLASEHVSEISVSVVSLPNDEMKGRIIGRNGRNIRSFEISTGVDVVVDDTPEAVTISSFDPVRREVAKRTMSKLVADGRIHPARIEKLVSDTQTEVNEMLREEGESAAYNTGVHGLHPEIIKLLGQLKFRTSYGQNQHAHAIETAHLAGMIAAELGANVDVAKAGGLLHDIGKAIDHEIEGTHAIIGSDFIKRYGVSEDIVNCVAAHHHEVEPTCVEAYIVEAADAISGARPGARRESLENYVKRVKMLEEIANGFEGVEQSYALQAGREVRILVRPDEIDDLGALELAKNVAKQIEDSMQYPGQIKVHVIRETRAIDYAK